jgi:carbamoyl-phosphate synthase small subunit
MMPMDATAPSHFPDPNAEHLVKEVSRKKSELRPGGKHKIIAVDCGIKENILRNLQRFPIDIQIVPFDYDYSQDEFDGVFLSNGPGDPERCVETITHLQKILPLKKPIFGICLGAQILALAIGAKTYKLPFGHRGQNQPCLDTLSQKAYLTSQNHGYAIDEKTLPSDWQVTFRHLNDQTVAGIAHTKLPYFAVQFHPEAAPGPHDTQFLFEKFYEYIV